MFLADGLPLQFANWRQYLPFIYGIMDLMKARVDKFGRLVLPQPLRQRINLQAGDTVEIEEEHGQITIRPAPMLSPVTREEEGLLVLHAELPGNQDPVRSMREEQLRRERGGK